MVNVYFYVHMGIHVFCDEYFKIRTLRKLFFYTIIYRQRSSVKPVQGDRRARRREVNSFVTDEYSLEIF